MNLQYKNVWDVLIDDPDEDLKKRSVEGIAEMQSRVSPQGGVNSIVSKYICHSGDLTPLVSGLT